MQALHNSFNGLSQNKYDVYRFRVKLPSNIQRYFHRTEINKSLNTKDAKIAQSKAMFLYDNYQKLLRLIEMSVLTEEQIQELVDTYVTQSLEQDKLDRATKGWGTLYTQPDLETHGGNYAIAMGAEIDNFIGEYKEQLAHNDYSSVISVAKEILTPLGIDFNDNEPTHRLFLQSLMRGTIEVLEEGKNRYYGNYNTKYDAPKGTKKPTKVNKEATTYKDAFNRFMRYYNTLEITQETKDDTLRVLEKLLIMQGEHSCIEETDLDDMLDIQETISNLPNLNRLPYKDMDFQAIMELTSVPDEHKISDNRAKDYIKHIKKFFAFCHDENIISYNPSVRLNVTVDADKKDAFSDEEMKQLIRIVKTLDDNLKYLYMSYIYTGMRREELFNSVIEEVEGIPYFNIQRGKNTASIRSVPLHSELIKMELTNEKLQSAKSVINFNNLGRKFNESIKSQVTQSNRKTLHSLRHTVATKLQNEGVPDETIRAIIGHAAQDTLNRVYTASTSTGLSADKARRLKEAIDKLSFN
jgi:integrase